MNYRPSMKALRRAAQIAKQHDQCVRIQWSSERRLWEISVEGAGANPLETLPASWGRRRNSRASIPNDVRAAVFNRDGERCQYCGTIEGPFHLDHVFPYSRGGANTEDNLVVACKPCNYDKRARTPEEWIAAKAAAP